MSCNSVYMYTVIYESNFDLWFILRYFKSPRLGSIVLEVHIFKTAIPGRYLKFWNLFNRQNCFKLTQNPKLSEFLEFARFLGKFIRCKTNVTVSDFYRWNCMSMLGYILAVCNSQICIRGKLMNQLTRTWEMERSIEERVETHSKAKGAA